MVTEGEKRELSGRAIRRKEFQESRRRLIGEKQKPEAAVTA
jgi:hypothetical protein